MPIRLKLTSVVLLWISFWVLMANFSLGGLYSTSIELNILAILGLASFWIGSLFFLPSSRNTKNFQVHDNTLFQLKKGFKLAVTICAIVQIYLLWKFIVILMQDPSLLTRQLLFGTVDQDSVLFDSKEFALLYFVFVQAAMRIAVITGFVLSFFTGKFKYLVIGNLLSLTDSLLFLGRGALLEFVFQIIFFFLVSYELRRKLSRWTISKIGLSIVTLIFFGAIVGAIRGDTESINISSFVKYQIVNYHTVGFVILDQELSDQQSRLNINTTFGMATLGGIERLAVLVIRRFDKSIDSVSGENGEYLAEFRVLGRNDEGQDLNYNAFATIFYTFFLDGGYLFVVFGMMAFGIWMSRVRALFLSGHAFHLSTLYVLVQAGFNSVFFSPVESTTFWIVIIALFLIRKLKPRRLAGSDNRSSILAAV
jgi:oligosaccharide repeat unit polymerase